MPYGLSEADLTRCETLAGKIGNEIAESPAGVITYGAFVSRSLYGYPDDQTGEGYYTQSNFSPNNNLASARADTFTTIGAYPGAGRALGEKLGTLISPDIVKGEEIDFIEIGGGDGKITVGIISELIQTLHSRGKLPKLGVTSIDRTDQLLTKQARAVEALRSNPKNSLVRKALGEHELDNSPIETKGSEDAKDKGIVFSNELLDMLPFEVAVRANGVNLLYVELTADGEFIYTFRKPGDELEELAAKTLERYPDKLMKSFQPELLPTMQRIAGLIESGQVLTVDYKYDDNMDVQIVRNCDEVKLPGVELDYPGAFDISTTPDWERIVEWANSIFGTDNVAYGPVKDLIGNSKFTTDISLFTGNPLAGKFKETRQLSQVMKDVSLGLYDYLLIKK
jgi:SAM-dependent MidA family methyltransferase